MAGPPETAEDHGPAEQQDGMMTVTRENLHPAYHREVGQEEIMRASGEDIRPEDVSVRQLPERARMTTYPHPDGPAFVSTGQGPVDKYGEDPTDPALQQVPRRRALGMIGRLNPAPQARKSS